MPLEDPNILRAMKINLRQIHDRFGGDKNLVKSLTFQGAWVAQ